MKEYQRTILSFGQTIGTSRLAIVVLALISITYFGNFVSNLLKFSKDPANINLIDVFNLAGVLALSIAAAFVAYTQIKAKQIKSRRIVMSIFVAASWGTFPTLMKINPWNFVLAAVWIVVGLLVCRRSQWERVQSD